MTPGRAALIGLMDRYIRILLDPYVTLLEVHKLLYFMQSAGEKLRLRYRKAPYGPYAENLRHVLQSIDGHFISGYAGSREAPHEPLDLLPGAVADASSFLIAHPQTRARFDRVVTLIEGFESSFGLELLATVHWVVVQEGAASADDVVGRIHAWGRIARSASHLAKSVSHSTYSPERDGRRAGPLNRTQPVDEAVRHGRTAENAASVFPRLHEAHDP